MDDNHHQFRHLLLHHLMAKPPPEQVQAQYRLQQQHHLQDSLLRSQMLLRQQSPPPLQSPQILHQPATRKRAYKKAAAAAGEIVEVQGGHIIRSTGRKDRHSKVCTAKGPRDRRVRLSAQTAIQFYDVQDRLGYDRPSKAVDWLLKKAQSSIDELDELPPWKPTNVKRVAGDEEVEEEAGGGDDESSGLLPPSMDSDSAPVQLQSYQSQDLKLSLQSQEDHQIKFDSAGWEVENSQPVELGRFQRLLGWNPAGGSSYNGNGNGFMFIPPSQSVLFGQPAAATHLFSQRGTLQSNNAPLVTASNSHHHQPVVSVHHPVSFPGIGFGSSLGGFPSFHIPARFQGDHQEEQDGNVSNKPSSVASGSRH